jgi:hypothetical protein
MPTPASLQSCWPYFEWESCSCSDSSLDFGVRQDWHDRQGQDSLGWVKEEP